MFFVWIHCMDVSIHCTYILIECKCFLYVFSSIPRKLYTIIQSTFFPIKRYQDILFKLLILSTDSVTKKITVVHAIYFYNSGSIFATKNFVTESVLKVRSFMRDILASLDREKMGAGRWCITFWVTIKNMEKSLLTFV